MEEDTTIPPLPPALTRSIFLILGCAIAGLVLASALPLLFPKQYRATVTLQIKDLPSLSATLQEDTARIKSPDLLGLVVDQLELPKRWSKSSSPLSREDATRKLAKSISVSAVRNTELVKISVDDTDSRQAATLANAIALEFQNFYAKSQEKLALDHLKDLQQDADQLHAKTEQLRQKAATLRSQESEADRNSGYMGESLPPQVGSPAYLAAQRNYLQAKEIEDSAQRILAAAKIQNAMPAKRVILWERAEPPPLPIALPPFIRLALGAFLGAILGSILSLFVKRK